jgi:purine-binding chemotaxis protein CheW
VTAGDDVQLVAFRVAGQEFAFNIFQVERILRYEPPAPLPRAPEFLEGVGLVVDGVTEVLQVPAGDVAAPPPIVQGLAAEYITGLVVRGERTVIVLNAGRLLSSTEQLALAAAVSAEAGAR